ncbi:hypothetical protein [Candidatus Uabimicrobium sp. HlEnr_7]|uniref:hypothetical protein n=1 Tax=Candidatus Uabimicrobium helgolandensis TaxID=3095367 RepID=UPI003558F0E9
MFTLFIRNLLMVFASVFGSVCAIFVAMAFSEATNIFPQQNLYVSLSVCIFLTLISLIALYVMAKRSSSPNDMELLKWLLSGLATTFFLVAMLTYMLITTFKEELL